MFEYGAFEIAFLDLGIVRSGWRVDKEAGEVVVFSVRRCENHSDP